MNGHDRNMFWQAHRPQSASMILLSIVLLSIIDLTSATIQCSEKTCCKTLTKGVKLAKLMSKRTEDLLKTYQTSQGDFAEQFCKMQMENVPSSSLSGQTPDDRVLSIYTRLKEFLPHMKKVLEQQIDLQPPRCVLLSELAESVQQAGHLIQKVKSIYQILQPNIPIPEPAAGPTGIPLPQNVFQQKVYGCVILTRLNEFLSNVMDELRSLKGSKCIKRKRVTKVTKLLDNYLN